MRSITLIVATLVIGLLGIIKELTINSAYAYPIFNYSPSKVTLSNEAYKNNVKIPLNSMVQNYYSILKNIRPIHEDLIAIKQTILELNWEWSTWEKNCPTVSYECSLDLHKIYEKVTSLDKVLMETQKNKLNLSLASSSNDEDALIYISDALNELSNINFHIYHLIEEFLITSNTPYFRNIKSSDRFGPLLHEMKLLSENILTAQLDSEYKEEFEFIWNEFIRPSEQFVLLQNKGLYYFLTRLEDLNMAWNSFHMKTVKSSLNVPENAQQTIMQMHSTWNGILRSILSNYR